MHRVAPWTKDGMFWLLPKGHSAWRQHDPCVCWQSSHQHLCGRTQGHYTNVSVGENVSCKKSP